MSAFVGLVNLDGAPVKRDYLEKMASYLALIGPDQQQVWTDGEAGMAHALLKTTPQGVQSSQPIVRGDYTIVGDARIDGRKELLAALDAQGIHGIGHKQDMEIILHAWLLWKDKLTDHLIGDFSLAIWDKAEKKLFGLRDHMGVRPFFYARVGDLFLYSNVLNCIRQHPSINSALNDQAVVDFLAFGHNLEFSTTIFKDICRLEPAHFMEVSLSGTRVQRYWSLPNETGLRFRKNEDYVEHFRQLLDLAVSDRLPDQDTGVAMSGGLDSTAVATCAHELLSAPNKLSLFTLDIKSLWPEDEEEKHAALLANMLGVELHIQRATGDDLFEDESVPAWALPEPSRDAFRLPLMAVVRKMALQNRVGLTGHGSDSVFTSSPDHFNRLIREQHWSRFLSDAIRYIQVFHRRPPINLRATLKKKLEKSPWQPTIPNWLTPEIVAKTGLVERFTSRWDQMSLSRYDAHPERPEAFLDISSSIWPPTLLRFDPQTTGVPIEFRHPFFDIRLLQFSLAIPAMPWFQKKQLLRLAMRGRMPEEVRTRLKSMPKISPVHRGIAEKKEINWRGHLANLKNTTQYIDLNVLQRQLVYTNALKSDEADLVGLPIAFGNWLKLNSLEL